MNEKNTLSSMNHSYTHVLVGLEEWQQIAFGAALVARMLPNYALFCELTDSHETGVATVKSILSCVWEFASGVNDSIDFQKQQDKLEVVTPDPQNFSIYGVWPALDAAVGLNSLLSVCGRFDSEELQSLPILSLSTIEQYLDALGVAADSVNRQGLLDMEAEALEQIMQLLVAGASSNRKGCVKSLRSWVQGLQLSNIGLEVSR